MANLAGRADEVRKERRRKPGATVNLGQKLGVDESLLDRKTYEYRWVNDAGMRVRMMHENDWDPAPEVSTEGQSVEKRPVGVNDGGRPIEGVLMRKRKDWYDDDQKAKRRPLDEMDEAIRRGAAHKESELAGGIAYTPGSGNSLTR